MIKVGDKTVYHPVKYIARKYQLDALEFIKKSILTGKKYVLLNLPTGTGKSLLAASMLSNWYLNFINPRAKFDIVTNSKVLQEQYLKEFDFICNYKGRSNYFCDMYNTDCANGKELCKLLKPVCSYCQYDQAKLKWISCNIGLTNLHLFDTLSLFQKKVIGSRNSNVLIIDESHDFESVFSDYLSTKLSAKTLKKCGFTLKEIEDFDTMYISKIKKLDRYISFLQNTMVPELEKKLSEFEQTLLNVSDNKRKTQLSTFIQNVESRLLSYKNLFTEYSEEPSNIVLEINTSKIETELTTQHIWAFKHLEKNIWKNYDHVIFLSGTILNKGMFCYLNGLDPEISSYYEMNSPFPIKNRPIYYLKVGKMNYGSKEETFQKQVVWIKHFLKKFKNEKGIIHTTTYEIQKWVQENIFDDRLLFHETDDRNDILEKHINSKLPTVIVSPSFISGISLDDDLCRFSIILKVPYPNLGSKKIDARRKSNANYYTYKTISDLTQTYGRGIRSETDYCSTFILDSNFSDLMKYSGDMIPKYIKDAIQIMNI